jgi:hypothetical protein
LVNKAFLEALANDFREGGAQAIAQVRKQQPAAYMKICALLVPREMKVQHSQSLKSMSDEELDAAIEYLRAMLAAQAGDGAKVRARKALNAETIAELHKAFRRGGAKAIDKVMKNNPAMFLKLLVLLVPREMQVEQSGGVKAMSDEQLERGIELIKEMLAQREAGANAKVIEGEAEDRACRRPEAAAQGLRSASPKVLEPVGRHLGVPDRMLDVPVAEVVLQSPCVVAIIGELKTTGMAQHVWVDRERHLGSLADPLDEAVEADGTDWSAALGNEHVSLFRVFAAQPAESPHLVTPDGMHAGNAVLDAVHMQAILG